MSKTMTNEEKVAIKLIDLLSDIKIDLHLVGYYFANLASKGLFLRLEAVQASAEETIEDSHDREAHYRHIVTLGKD